MHVPFYPESIKQQTWVGRALDLVEPVAHDGVPWPVAWQTARGAEYEVYLPESIGGAVPAAEAFVVAQIAIQAAEGGAAAAQPVALERVAVYAPARHGTYAVDVAAGDTVTLFQGSRQRPYVLIVNQGANDAFLAYGKDADARSLPLASGGDGFHELVFGTRSSASVFSPLGTTIVVIDGLHDPELGDDDA